MPNSDESEHRCVSLRIAQHRPPSHHGSVYDMYRRRRRSLWFKHNMYQSLLLIKRAKELHSPRPGSKLLLARPSVSHLEDFDGLTLPRQQTTVGSVMHHIFTREGGLEYLKSHCMLSERRPQLPGGWTCCKGKKNRAVPRQRCCLPFPMFVVLRPMILSMPGAG